MSLLPFVVEKYSAKNYHSGMVDLRSGLIGIAPSMLNIYKTTVQYNLSARFYKSAWSHGRSH